MPENGGKKETQLGGSKYRRFELPLHPILSTLCAPLFSGYSGHWATDSAVKRRAEESGRCEIYCRQFRSNFGEPLNVSYQYAMYICTLLFCVRIFTGTILLFLFLFDAVSQIEYEN
jgi:hypothetical protein